MAARRAYGLNVNTAVSIAQHLASGEEERTEARETHTEVMEEGVAGAGWRQLFFDKSLQRSSTLRTWMYLLWKVQHLNVNKKADQETAE